MLAAHLLEDAAHREASLTTSDDDRVVGRRSTLALG